MIKAKDPMVKVLCFMKYKTSGGKDNIKGKP